MIKSTAITLLALLGIGLVFAMDGPEDKFVGKPGPEFQVEQWISDKPNTTGKYMLVDFWATWCGPCLRAVPHMNELHAEFGDKLAVIGVSREPRETVEAMKNPVMDYYSAIDTQGRMGRFFEIRTIPHVVLMDPDGIVVWKGHPGGLSKDVLRSLIENA